MGFYKRMPFRPYANKKRKKLSKMSSTADFFMISSNSLAMLESLFLDNKKNRFIVLNFFIK
jgi:hypothetical protein